MARSADDQRRRKSKSDSDPGYEVLPDDEERHDAEYRRRHWGDEEEDDEPVRRTRRRVGKFPRIVDVLGVAAAIASPVAGLLGAAGLVYGVATFSKFVGGTGIILLGAAVYFGQIALSVYRRRVSDELLRRSLLVSLAAGGLLGMVALSLLAIGWGKDPLWTIGMVGVALSGAFLGFAALVFVTREGLVRWQAERRRWRD